jgi:hypothetical protein
MKNQRLLQQDVFSIFQIDFDSQKETLKKLDDDCKKSWDYLRVIAKHESSSSVKPR